MEYEQVIPEQAVGALAQPAGTSLPTERASVRDMFAMVALPTMMNRYGMDDPAFVAEQAYRVADWMMQARCFKDATAANLSNTGPVREGQEG